MTKSTKPIRKSRKVGQTKNTATHFNLQPVPIDGYLTDLTPEIQRQLEETACDMAAEGMTLHQIADAIGISQRTLARIRRKYPEIAQALDVAAFDGALWVLDRMRDTPETEPDAQRARVKIDALCRWLELRWPHRFGKRLEIEHKGLDMGSALERSEQRAKRVIESVAYEVLTTDTESVVTEETEET